MFNDHDNHTTRRPVDIIDDAVIADTQFVKSTPFGTKRNRTNFCKVRAKPFKFSENIFPND